MKQIIEFDKCTGCYACHDICPTNAISFEIKDGFFYPIINQEKCIDCGKCLNVCPMLNKIQNDEYNEFFPEVYAAQNLDKEQLQNSTSGGVFGALAQMFIEKGGYVSGVVFSNDYKSCHHTLTNKPEDVSMLMQSKYFQSDVRNNYKNIRKLLQSGESVMFCGTPCQSAALFSFLNGTNMDNLIMVDLFCKGVPSPVIHEKYLSLLEKKERSKITFYRSKSKVHGWGKFYTEVRFQNGKNKYIRSPLDSLFVTQALNVRKSCASCIYKGYDRVSDITIGDFWGIEGLRKETISKGISALIVNTQKGANFIKRLTDKIVLYPRSIFDVSNIKNPGYSNNVILNENYENFYRDINRYSFNRILKKYAINNSRMAIAYRKAKWILSKLSTISIHKFIYINFISKHVKRGKNAFIIPGRSTHFVFKKGSIFILEKGVALINIRKPRGSREEAWIELQENAKLIIRKKLDMRNSRIGVQKDAIIDIVDLEMNGLCNFMARKEISIGDGVMIARNVTIYDSDYHPFSIEDGIQTIATRPVNIGNHVWIGNGAMIMKGVTIEDGAVIGARSLVLKRVKKKSLVSGNPAKEICKGVFWSKGH